jgi:ribose transport system permease protein
LVVITVDDDHSKGEGAVATRGGSQSRQRTLRTLIERWRYRFIPDHVIGEILTKRWIDSAIPFTVLIVVLCTFYVLLPTMFQPNALAIAARQLGEFGLVCLAMMVVVISGGIDLSVGSNFALGNFTALYLLNLGGWPLWAAIPAVLVVCGLVGLFNGLLIGYLRLRAFLTTLVTLIIVRALVDILLLRYAQAMSMGFFDDDAWTFLGLGDVFGVPTSFIVMIVIFAIAHVIFSRSGPGWRAMAIGGSRKSSYNIGINVKRTVCATYVISGVLCGMASVLYAARLGGSGTDTGVGLEISVLTAVVLGGISLGGGRGTVSKAVIGAIIVLMLTNGVIQLGLNAGSGSMVLGITLIFAVLVDVKWVKHRDKLLNKVYMSPALVELPRPATTVENSSSPYAVNDKLKSVETLALGQVEGPEDVILDSEDNLYCGNRQGDIIRFRGPNYDKAEILAHIGGHTLGMALDPEQNIFVCVGGMGLYRVSRSGEVTRATDETNRSRFSIIDDSRLRLADDLDIAPDGRVFFSEATIRYEMHTWPMDALESRGNGRIICWDPKTNKTQTVLRGLVFPNGICIEPNGQSLLFAESWGCRVNRYWFDGPKRGTVEVLVSELPGYPDNINRSSDGNYWVALLGMRSPALDVALRMPGFRRRMARRLAPDEWLYPNLNTGCVVKMAPDGTVLESLWDLGAENHPMITSMREHKGWLYLGGISNNRIGRYRIPGADPNWNGFQSYWEKAHG